MIFAGLIGLLATTLEARASYWQTTLLPGPVIITGQDACGLALEQYRSVHQTPTYFTPCEQQYDALGRLVAVQIKGFGPGFFNGEYLFSGSGQATLECEGDEVRLAEGCTSPAALRRREVSQDLTCPSDRPGRPSTPDPAPGNPVRALSGQKSQWKIDFSTEGPFPLAFARFYSSPLPGGVPNGHKSSLGLGWSSNFDARLFTPAFQQNNATIQLPDGRVFRFAWNGATYQPAYLEAQGGGFANGNHASAGSIAHVGATIEFTPDGDITYVFDSSQRLVTIRHRGGYVQTLSYNAAGQRSTVTDSFGRSLQFAYDAYGYLSRVTAADGRVFKYRYRTTLVTSGLELQNPGVDFTRYRNGANALESVILPDATAGTDADNPTLTYHYEVAADPSLLTGITDERGIRFSTFAYADGRATQTERAGGAGRFTFTHDDANARVSVTNPLGKLALYTYALVDGSVRRLATVDGQASPNCPAAQTSFTYDANSFVASITDGEGRTTSYLNDARGRPTSVTRGAGTPQAVTTTLTWHPGYRVPTQIVQPGLTENFTYAADGRLTSYAQTDTTSHTQPYSTNGQTRTWTYGYTGLLLTSIDGPLAGTGDRVTYAYNAQGYLQTFTNELGHITTVNSWNGRGQPARITDPNGLITDFAYNERGEIVTITVSPAASPRVTTLTRDLAGQITAIAAPGVTLTLAYDSARRLTRMTNADNQSVEYVHDLNGGVTRTISTAGATVLAERNAVFDELGRIIRSVGAGGVGGGRVWQAGWDRADNPVSTIDPRGQMFSGAFDALNRLIATTIPGPSTTALDLNGKDEIAGVTDPRNFTTSYTRNGFGEVIRRVSPDTGTTDYVHDSRGLLMQVTDARGFVTTFTYDNAGRRLTRSQTGAATENVTYIHDSMASGNFGRGRLTRVTDPAGSSDFRYDIHGNVIRETRIMGARTYTVNYAYDAGNRLTQITYPSGRVVAYARNNTGRVTSVTTRETSALPVVNLATGVTWRGFAGTGVAGLYGQATPMAAPMLPISETSGLVPPGGAAFPGARLVPPPVRFGEDEAAIEAQPLLASLTHGNRLTHSRAYDNDNLLTGLSVLDGAVARLSRTHAYGDNLGLTGIGDGVSPTQGQSFWLSIAGRLQNADGPWGSDLYSHNGVGNLTNHDRTVAGVTTSRVLGDAANSNRILVTLLNGANERSFVYDAAGNVTGDNRGAGGNFTYGVSRTGRIVSASRNGVLQGAYSYDAFERLRSRTLSNQTPANLNGVTHYVWDIFGNIIAEMNGSTGAALRETVYLEGMPLSAIDAAASPKRLYAIHTDHLHRPVLMTDATKSTVWQAVYEPYGRVFSITGSATNNLALPGQWFQLETGLNDNWHRHYDASLARYTTPDPLGFVDGPAIYAYAGGAPQLAVDEDGLTRLRRPPSAPTGFTPRSPFNGLGPINRGREAEARVRATCDIGSPQGFSIFDRQRISDGTLPGSITEIKNVRYQSYSQQIRDELNYAIQTGRQFNLYLPPNASVSRQLQNQIGNGNINRLKIPE